MAGMSSLTGGGGLSASSSNQAQGGNSTGVSGTGAKTFNFGSNPNLSTSSAIEALSNPLVIGAALVGFIVYSKFKSKKR